MTLDHPLIVLEYLPAPISRSEPLRRTSAGPAAFASRRGTFADAVIESHRINASPDNWLARRNALNTFL